MISFAIIVFREVLEISLILSVLFAATSGLKGRGLWVIAGLTIGGIGAGIVALFSGSISNALEGLGQEVFNATVLILAAALIGWTIIWMKRTSRTLTLQLQQLGAEMVHGRKPLCLLAVVTGLSMLRDGSEVVLLTHGVMATGQGVTAMLIGSVFGIISGALVGLGIYYGIIRIGMQHIFSVTSWMLILLSAGMVAKAIGFLSAAGYVPEIVYPVWNTSAILSEQSFFGQICSVLFGYTASPSGSQCLGYLLTIVLIASLLRSYGKAVQPQMSMVVATLVCCSLACVLPQTAQAVDKIYSPTVSSGEFEIEARGIYDIDDRDDRDGASKEKFEVGYGFTDRFAASVYAIVEDEPGEDVELKEYELAGRYELTEQGEHWLDAGLYLALEANFDEDAYVTEGKVLLEKESDRFVSTLNLITERALSDSGDFEGELAFRSKYRASPGFEPGVELHSEFGEIDNIPAYDEQEHSIGPAIYGQLFGNFRYELAGLFGISAAAPDATIRWMLEYEHYF